MRKKTLTGCAHEPQSEQLVSPWGKNPLVWLGILLKRPSPFRDPLLALLGLGGQWVTLGAQVLEQPWFDPGKAQPKSGICPRNREFQKSSLNNLPTQTTNP